MSSGNSRCFLGMYITIAEKKPRQRSGPDRPLWHHYTFHKPVLVLSSSITPVLTALLAFLTDRMSLPILYFLCPALGIFSSAVVAIGFTTTKELFPVRIAGTATGLVTLFPFLGGAVFQPLLEYALKRHGRVAACSPLQVTDRPFFCSFLRGHLFFGFPLSQRDHKGEGFR